MTTEDIKTISQLKQRVSELKTMGKMVEEEAIKIERDLERLYAPVVEAPSGNPAGNLLTEAQIAKINAPALKKLLAAKAATY